MSSLILVLIVLLSPHPDSSVADTVRVDHLILGINNLERGIDEFERLTGVRPVFGGQHPGRGTANALVSLGDGTYLELLGPSSASGESMPAALASLQSMTPYGWALGTTDLAATVERLRARGIGLSPIRDGSRRKPDNSMLTWRTAAPTGAGLETAPFLIEWGTGTTHPSTTSPTGCRLLKLTATGLDPAALKQLLDAAGINAPVERGPRPLAFTLACPKGEIRFE